MRLTPHLSRFFLFTFLAVVGFAQSVTIHHSSDAGPILFGAAELRAALAAKPPSTPAAIHLELTSSPATQSLLSAHHSLASPPTCNTPESFSIRLARTPLSATDAPRQIHIFGHDPAGLMYGALEAAEIIRTAGLDTLADTDQSPHFATRGIKFNLPLDARTPSYTDAGESAQQNIATVWDMSFWRDYIDRLARDRYDLVSLWNLHPFPSLVRVPEYPDVALADVHRSTAKWDEYYHTWATGLDAPELLDHVEVLKKITIDEKIAFWREVMRYGRSRNVKFYVITWNVFTNGTRGQYGLTPDWANPTTADYVRRSVRELILTYPDLAGIGLTTGENMPDATAAEKEDWAFRTFGQGVLDALAIQPDRQLAFIHRQHEAAAAEIAQRFAPLIQHPGIEFTYSFKYAEAHALSSTTQNFHTNFLRDVGDQPVLWTLRNDDSYFFRWAAPDFVRDFIRNIPTHPTRGFYYGSDQWIWARDFLDLHRAPDAPRQLEHDKHWLHWLLWGRFGYNPNLSDARIVSLVAERFAIPTTDAAALLAAWQDASMIYPLVTGFHWGRFDFQWYIEASKSRPEPAQTPTGFHDLNRFISLAPHPTSNNVSIPDYVAALRKNEIPRGTTPPQLVQTLHTHADRALAYLDQRSTSATRSSNPELRQTLADIRIIAHLGKHYAHKIAAATELALLRDTLAATHRDRLASELNAAALHWRTFSSLALTDYKNPVWMNRVGHVDWRKLYSSVLYDLTTTGSPVSIPSMQPTPGGTILEAEYARVDRAAIRADVPGFTGSGYRDFGGSQGRRWIEWTYDAPAAGRYILEFRYAMRRHDSEDATLSINGQSAPSLTLWPTGSLQSWAWDRVVVELRAGPNTLRLHPPLGPNIDHLNIFPFD